MRRNYDAKHALVSVLEFAVIVAGLCSGIAAIYSIIKDNRGAAAILAICCLASIWGYARSSQNAISIDLSGSNEVIRATSARLHWSVMPKTALVTLQGERVPNTDDREIVVDKDSTFRLLAILPDGKSAERTWTIHALPVPIEISFAAERNAVQSGESVKVSWQVSGDAAKATIIPRYWPYRITRRAGCRDNFL